MRRPDSARSRSQMNRVNHSHLHSVCLQTLVESNVNVTNITSLFAAIVNVRSVEKRHSFYISYFGHLVYH